MARNSFGTLFRITTWGESHGKAIGVVVDGCPAGLALSEEDIREELKRRAPGNSPLTSPRKEQDLAEIYSGVYEGVTTGAPISIIIANRDVDSSKYTPLENLYRPGHANRTYLAKYGVFDPRGSGRASARETACRVAAGAIAKKFLAIEGIEVRAHLEDFSEEEVLRAKAEGDSIGGTIAFVVEGVPEGIGDPIYLKVPALLATAIMSIPAVKGFEMGQGFTAAKMRGSMHNDSFALDGEKVVTTTNHSGGTLGGITTGMPLWGRVALKPPSSIAKEQETLTRDNQTITFSLPAGSRQDPCVAIRAVPVVEAMIALVLADLILLGRSSKL